MKAPIFLESNGHCLLHVETRFWDGKNTSESWDHIKWLNSADRTSWPHIKRFCFPPCEANYVANWSVLSAGSSCWLGSLSFRLAIINFDFSFSPLLSCLSIFHVWFSEQFFSMFCIHILHAYQYSHHDKNWCVLLFFNALLNAGILHKVNFGWC